MGGIGPEKLVLVLLLALLFFGAKRIPEIGSSLGKGIKEFKQSLSSLGDDAEGQAREKSADVPPVSRLSSATSAEPVRGEPRRLSTDIRRVE